MPNIHTNLYGQGIDAEQAELLNDNDPKTIAVQAVIDARKAKKMTQKELSAKTGIAQSDISKLENGYTNPTVTLLGRLADAMGMTVKFQLVPKNQ